MHIFIHYIFVNGYINNIRVLLNLQITVYNEISTYSNEIIITNR